MRIKYPLSAFAALTYVALAAPAVPQTSAPLTVKNLERVAQVKHGPLNEISGIVKSRTYPDTYYVHNDSGDTARFFAMDGKGKMIVPPFLVKKYTVDEGKATGDEKPFWPGFALDGAANYDWEEVAYDGESLYFCDTGNNGNARRDLGVYVVTEPNPKAIEHVRVEKWLHVAYEDQAQFPPLEWQYDCEAVFAMRGKLYFITKHRAMGNINIPAISANLYRMDTQYTDRLNVLKKIDGKSDMGGWVTAASLSRDGKTLAVLCNAPVPSVWLFESTVGDKFLSGKARRRVISGVGQAEAICWDDAAALRITNETGDIFILKTQEFATASTRPRSGARRTARK